MARKLADGVYEELVTAGLDEAIAVQRGARAIEIEDLAGDRAHVVLARFLRREIEHALEDVEGEQDGDADEGASDLDRAAKARRRLTAQVAVTNDVLRVLIERDLAVADQALVPPARELREVRPLGTTRLARPMTPLASSALLTPGHREHAIGKELAREMASADRVDVLMSFVTVGGVRQLREAIEALGRRHRVDEPPRLRLLTTTYTGATEAAAVEALARIPGVAIKISYDGRRTRLHAKAWLFHRASGLSTAYVGSANLSSPALTYGLEWMMKTSALELPAVIAKFEGTFETLWADREFEAFDPQVEADTARLRGALSAAARRDEASGFQFFTLAPYEFQREILEQLEAERSVHRRFRNLVVAATGTGKTMIAAFDYQRRVRALGTSPRLLFLAHTRQILQQARTTFRYVLLDGGFGALLTGEDEPHSHDHLFATIQTVRSRGLIDTLGGDYWDHIVIDECHHVPSDQYQGIMSALRPTVLVGLTATPERTDGRSLLPDFEHRVAAELRLWSALERQLLSPFEYYGLHDGVSADEMARVQWRRGTGYDVEELGKLYTGNEARAAIVLAQLQRRVTSPTRIRALGFCVSVDHAVFMARYFNDHGVAATALSGSSTMDERAAGQRDLRDGRIHVIFTCDLFNEGVDLPFVDTLLLLRPTQSATLFLQQLGRGLRLYDGKASCLVLDFIGQHRVEFRFDKVLSALTGLARPQLVQAAIDDFPYLPSGCAITLDPVARETILGSLKANLGTRWRAMVSEAAHLEPDLTLARYLTDTGRDLAELYRMKDGSWSRLLHDLGRVRVSEEDLRLCHHLRFLLHLDDRDRLIRIQRWLDGAEPKTALEQRDALMLGYQLVHDTKRKMTGAEVPAWIRAHPAATRELGEVAAILADRVSLPAAPRPVDDWPLVLHRHYSRREILTACGSWNETRKVPHQQGVERLPRERRELLFVTLDKSTGSFSSTTSYRDYAISPDLFHWETQNKVAADSPRARHYAEHVAQGWSMHLCVQLRTDTPFAYLGPVIHERQSGSLPVAIVWRLQHTMPAALFSAYATLANG